MKRWKSGYWTTSPLLLCAEPPLSEQPVFGLINLWDFLFSFLYTVYSGRDESPLSFLASSSLHPYELKVVISEVG